MDIPRPLFEELSGVLGERQGNRIRQGRLGVVVESRSRARRVAWNR